MEISVWDTYVPRTDGKVMHFDILVPNSMNDEGTIFRYGRQYLKSKAFSTGKLTAEECRFCHMEQASPEIEKEIQEKGYFIIEMDNCS